MAGSVSVGVAAGSRMQSGAPIEGASGAGHAATRLRRLFGQPVKTVSFSGKGLSRAFQRMLVVHCHGHPAAAKRRWGVRGAEAGDDNSFFTAMQ